MLTTLRHPVSNGKLISRRETCMTKMIRTKVIVKTLLVKMVTMSRMIFHRQDQVLLETFAFSTVMMIRKKMTQIQMKKTKRKNKRRSKRGAVFGITMITMVVKAL